MLNYELTNTTEYTFVDPLCNICDNVNYIGITPSKTLESALKCPPVSDTWVQLFVPQIVDVPECKPPMEGIVSVSTQVNIISKRVIATPVVTGYTNPQGVAIPGSEIPNAECTLLTGRKLIIEGVIFQKIVYTALQTDQALHSATFSIPFSTFILIDPDTPLTQDYKLYVYLEDAFACMLSECSIFSNTTMFIKTAPVC